MTWLSGLPLELLTKILEVLDWADVLRVRKTSKVLLEASKTRSIWLNLCRQYLTPTVSVPQILHIERPIQLYTSHELEFLHLRLESAKIGWKTNDKSPSRMREIVTATNPKCMYLVEGGRWLLVAFASGSVTYFDLDTPTPTESSLIPHQFDYDYRRSVSMTIDRDYDTPFLTFNLIVSFSCESIPLPHPEEHGIQIWSVSLALDDAKQGIGLTAIRLASFPLEYFIAKICALSMRGPHLAFSFDSVAYRDCQLTFVICWRKVVGSLTDCPRRLVRPGLWLQPDVIHLLPDNKLLTSGDEGLMIFDYLSIPETMSWPPFDFASVTAVPLWRHANLALVTNLREPSISKPFFCSHSIRFSACDPRNLLGLIVPYPYHQGPEEELVQVVKFMQNIRIFGHRAAFGYNKAAFSTFHVAANLLGYSWPDEQHNLSPTLLHKGTSDEESNFGPILDEGSGRVILPSDMTPNTHHIWDYAFIYNSN